MEWMFVRSLLHEFMNDQKNTIVHIKRNLTFAHAAGLLHLREPYKKQNLKFCVPNLLTTTAKQPFPTQCYTEEVHRLQSVCLLSDSRPLLFVSVLFSEEPPVLLMLFLKCKQGKGSGWTRERGAQER